MQIVSVRAVPWTLPLRAPFSIATRTAHAAHNVRVSVQTDNPALQGYGECAPVFYVTGETVDTVLAALSGAGAALAEVDGTSLDALWAQAGELLPGAPAARAGLEMALADAWGKNRNVSLWTHFGGRQSALTTDVTIPLVTPDEAARWAADAWGEGFRHLKIKVGDAGGPDADLLRIAAIVRAAPGARLRIDANQAFTPDAAVRFAERLEATGAAVELMEQPVAKDDWRGLKFVKERVPVPVLADEAARDALSVAHLLAEDAVDGVNVKLMKLGLTGALEIIALCRAAGKPLMLGCMLESGLGIAAAAQIAGGTGAFDYLDLDSHRLLSPIAGLTGGFTCDGEMLRVGAESAGWGVSLGTLAEV